METGGYYYFSYTNQASSRKLVVVDLNGEVVMNLNLASYKLRVNHLVFSSSENLFYGIGSKTDSTLFLGTLDFNGNESILKRIG